MAGLNLPLGFVMGKRTMLHVTRRDEWRAWLEKHHESETEVWLVFFKTHTGRPYIAYEEAVEEALCFGWIDSIIRRLDDERYARKFTPRKKRSKWSALNRRRVAKLVREGRVTRAGIAKITFPLADGKSQDSDADPSGDGHRREERLSPKMERTLRANAKALENYRKLAPSYRRNYIGWVMSAKKEVTRERRFLELLGVLDRGEKLGMK